MLKKKSFILKLFSKTSTLSLVCLLWSHNCMIVCTSNLKLTSFFFIVITVAKNNSHCYSQKCLCLKFAWSNYQIVKSRVKMSSGPALFSFFFFFFTVTPGPPVSMATLKADNYTKLRELEVERRGIFVVLHSVWKNVAGIKCVCTYFFHSA